MAVPPPRGEVVVYSDFNLYYLMWDLAGREHRKASAIFRLVEQWKLSLITLYGKPTREAPGQQPSTINLAWALTVNGW